MSDAHLIQPRNVAVEEGEVLQAEVVTGIKPQPHLSCHLGGSEEWLDGLITVGGISSSIRLSVKFHPVGASRRGQQRWRYVCQLPWNAR